MGFVTITCRRLQARDPQSPCRDEGVHSQSVYQKPRIREFGPGKWLISRHRDAVPDETSRQSLYPAASVIDRGDKSTNGWCLLLGGLVPSALSCAARVELENPQCIYSASPKCVCSRAE